MKVTTFAKAGSALGVASLLACTLAAMPAAADPVSSPSGTYGATVPLEGSTLVGFGSDTIQDVMDGIAITVNAAGVSGNNNALASYSAAYTGASRDVTPRGDAVAVPRASGSGAGRNELLMSAGGASDGNITVFTAPTAYATTANTLVGHVDYARSSGLSGATFNANGVLASVPFAKDKVTVAVAPNSPLANVPWVLHTGGSLDTTGATDGSNTPSVYQLYKTNAAHYVYIDSITNTYYGFGTTALVPSNITTAHADAIAIHVRPLLPKSGSGTRDFFIRTALLGTPTTGSITAGNGSGTAFEVFDLWANDDAVINDAVEEHTGYAIQDNWGVDGDGVAIQAIAPFSIPQWVTQSKAADGTLPTAVVDRRGPSEAAASTETSTPVQLISLDGQAPTTLSGSVYSTSATYTAIQRNVYNVVPTRWFDNPSSLTYKVFNGATSAVCQQTATIEAYGFAAIEDCGIPEERFGAPNNRATAEVSVSYDATTVTPDQTVTATVTGQLVTGTTLSNQGGTVQLKDASNTVVASAVIPAGQTQADLTFSFASVGTTSLKATFIPAWTGISAATEVAAQDIVTSLDATTVLVSKPNTFTIGTTADVIAWIDGVDPQGGKVVFTQDGVWASSTNHALGLKKLKTVTLLPGQQAAFYSFVPAHATDTFHIAYTPVDTAHIASSTADFVIAKVTPKVSGLANKTGISHLSAVAYSYLLTGQSGKYATGTVTVTISGGDGLPHAVTPKTLISSNKGAKTIVLPKLPKSATAYTISFAYSGDANYAAVTKTVTVKVTK